MLLPPAGVGYAEGMNPILRHTLADATWYVLSLPEGKRTDRIPVGANYGEEEILRKFAPWGTIIRDATPQEVDVHFSHLTLFVLPIEL